MQPNCCFYSSFIFIANSAIAHYYEYYIYSIIFAILYITSVIYHSTYNIYTNLLDKISIILVVSYGGWLFYDKLLRKDLSCMSYTLSMAIITTFLATIYLFYYGYCSSKYCFCEDVTVANYYHSFLHVISSFGHLLIIIL
jgi:hypothetical protein